MSESDSNIVAMENYRNECIERVNLFKSNLEEIRSEMAETCKECSKSADEISKPEELHKKALERNALEDLVKNMVGKSTADWDRPIATFANLGDCFDTKGTGNEVYDLIHENPPRSSESSQVADKSAHADNAKAEAE